MSTKRAVLVAIIALLMLSCTCPLTSVRREVDPELARYTEPEQIEEALLSMLAPYGLEGLEVYCSEDGVLIAFEPPREIGIGRLQMLYLSLIDTATLQAPFVPRVAVVTKVGGTQAFALTAATEDVKAWRRDEMTASELFKTFEIYTPEFEPLEGTPAPGSGEGTAIEAPTLAPVLPPWPTPADAPLLGAPGADEIMSTSAQRMKQVATADILFSQLGPGSYFANGLGEVLLPDSARVDKTSSLDEEAVETIVIGSTGYWKDDTAPGGWNMGPIAPFSSNPANWLELSQFYANATSLGDEEVNAVDCYHLQFTVAIPAGWLGLSSGGGSGEAWISKSDYSVIKAMYDLEYEGSREGGDMILTLELWEFNEPVTIVPPR